MPDSLIGDEGMDYIALTRSRSGAFFLARPRQDVGIDAHIEFRDRRGSPTGAIALIQSKAGLSYISPSGKYRILAEKRHFQIWSRYTLPVVGIVYNPARRDARWVNISDHLRANPACIYIGGFGISEIVKLLSTIDEENGLERGSSGQLVAVQLQAVGGIVPQLRSLVRDQSQNDHVRFYAVEILVEYLGHTDREFFRSVLEVEQCASMAEALQWALESCVLAEEIPFDA